MYLSALCCFYFALRLLLTGGSDTFFPPTQVRCTAGIMCSQRLGPGVENMPEELELAAVTPHQAVVCRLEHDGQKLEEGGLIFIQVHIIFTCILARPRMACCV